MATWLLFSFLLLDIHKMLFYKWRQLLNHQKRILPGSLAYCINITFICSKERQTPPERYFKLCCCKAMLHYFWFRSKYLSRKSDLPVKEQTHSKLCQNSAEIISHSTSSFFLCGASFNALIIWLQMLRYLSFLVLLFCARTRFD